MAAKKPLAQREKELQELLATPAGRSKLEELVLRYSEAGGPPRSEHGSMITYILVHEREHGLIYS